MDLNLIKGFFRIHCGFTIFRSISLNKSFPIKTDFDILKFVLERHKK